MMHKEHTMNSRITGCLLLALLGFNARAELVLQIHPFKPPTVLVPAFTPLARHIGERMDEPVSIRISRDYASHIDTVGQDDFDIAYMGPAPYVIMREKYGQKPLLARQAINDQPYFRGVIFVRNDSPLRSLAQLRGKRFAFGNSTSTMGSLVPQAMLLEAGVKLDQLAVYKHLSDHVNIALGVLSGDYDAGAVKEDVYAQYEPRGLRALATSPAVSDHLFVAKKKLAEEKIEKLRQALLTLHELPGGSGILQAMTPGVTRLVTVADSDYDDLRKLLHTLHNAGVKY